METDRRHAPRRRLDQLAYIRIGADNGGLIADLGEGGLGFQTIAAIEHEGPLRFWFTLDAADRIQATGELAWTDESRKVGGLRFTQITKEALDQIREWMERAGVPLDAEPPPRPAPRDPLRFSPPPRKSNPSSVPVTSSPILNQSVAVADAPPAPLPPIPPRHEPLRVMATPKHWSAPVLSEPPRAVVSPEMVKGATTGLTVLAVLLTLVALGFGYHREIGQSLARLGAKLAGESPLADVTPEPVPDSSAATAQQPLPAPADPAAAAQPAPVVPQDAQQPSISTQQPASSLPPAPKPAPRATTTRRPPASASTAGFQNLSASKPQGDDFGQPELDTARQFLESGTPNTKEAAKWLWMSVEKGNPAAEILLADLFARGDGVIKSCSQARVLLAAA
ncbi:MAG TPA: PilZ domain-containing protein, partial [Candidatus Acidoferrales bacterium]|nr:PilZ domain-containing protein [Candidatus Acidoferrales bacterium]